jgi:hypothetical protein
MTKGASACEGGEIIAQGEENSAVKNTAPESRITRRTSASTSIVFTQKVFRALGGSGASDKNYRFPGIVSILILGETRLH